MVVPAVASGPRPRALAARTAVDLMNGALAPGVAPRSPGPPPCRRVRPCSHGRPPLGRRAPPPKSENDSSASAQLRSAPHAHFGHSAFTFMDRRGFSLQAAAFLAWGWCCDEPWRSAVHRGASARARRAAATSSGVLWLQSSVGAARTSRPRHPLLHSSRSSHRWM